MIGRVCGLVCGSKWPLLLCFGIFEASKARAVLNDGDGVAVRRVLVMLQESVSVLFAEFPVREAHARTPSWRLGAMAFIMSRLRRSIAGSADFGFMAGRRMPLWTACSHASWSVGIASHAAAHSETLETCHASPELLGRNRFRQLGHCTALRPW